MDVLVPDLGDFNDVPVIEVLVKPGDRVKKNDSLVTLESDKASMEVPSSADGVVQDVKVKVGDKVSKGSVIVTLSGSDASFDSAASSRSAQDDTKNAGASRNADTGNAAASRGAGTGNAGASRGADTGNAGASRGADTGNAGASRGADTGNVGASRGADTGNVGASRGADTGNAGASRGADTGNAGASRGGDATSVILSEARSAQSKGGGAIIELTVPDVGDFHDIPVIDVLVKPGDAVKKEAPLVTLESEKASMDVPSTAEGTIEDVRVKVGDRVSQGTVIATLRTSFDSAASGRSAQDDTLKGGASGSVDAGRSFDSAAFGRSAQDDNARVANAAPHDAGVVHASPSIRRFARELGVDLRGVDGTGPNRRITREDVQRFVKRALAGGGSSPQGATSFAGLPPWPKVDFAQFGPIDRQALPRIKKISGPNLHRNWLQIPHITNYDEADVTELEAFRNAINAENAKSGGAKLTMLAFLIKASVAALKRFPEFNSSLDGEELVYKRYYNIGFAADTPNGLVVPVLKNADGKGLIEIARESAELAAKARDGKLGLSDMQGGTFTISSIGSIGGTQFTQIVNAPEVAILGATRAAMKPVWDGATFVPRLIQPISVSYDHRVIDGAGAARFLAYVASLLHDFKRVLL